MDLCMTCQRPVRWVGTPAAAVYGLGYLAPLVHAETGKEAGAPDGHPARPPLFAGFRWGPGEVA
jgi:hypothetical protein